MIPYMLTNGLVISSTENVNGIYRETNDDNINHLLCIYMIANTFQIAG